jgi:hypothetical protein
MRRALPSLAAIVLMLGVWGIALAAPDCTVTVCTYVPISLSGPPTATPIPPTPTKTPPPGVYIVGNTFSFVDSIDYLHVVGQVRNTRSSVVQFVRITADFYSGTGQLVANDFTYTWLDELAPNTTTCFEVSVKQPAGWATYQFEPVSYSTTTKRIPNLTIFNDSGGPGSFGGYQIIGLVQNNEAVQVKFVQVVGTLYNSDQTPIDCNFTYVNSTDLNPGQNSSFTLTTSGRDYSDVASYRLQASGNLP